MFVTLWEYEVKPGCEKRFEEAYGPAGDWARFFRSDSNYRETQLLRDLFRPAIYLTLDSWNCREAYEQFLAAHREQYKALDAAGEELARNEQRVGWFELIED